MLKKVIEYCIARRGAVIVAALVVAALGIYSINKTPIDAIPDLSDVQVIVFTEFEGQAPQVIEDQVTYPLTTALLNVPHAKNVRGYSFFGGSMIYVLFDDSTDIYWARSRVLEYLNFASKNLPKGVTPSIGPDATGVGWIFEYAITDKSGNHDLAELRSLQDWFIRYELQSVDGVAEVASIGGFVKQYQIDIDPTKLLAYDISIADVKTAVERSNADAGGRVVEMAESEFMVRSLGYIKSIEDIENIQVSSGSRGTPVTIKDIANVHLGPDLRRGVAELDGEGEVAGGIVVMRFKENAREVIRGVKEKLEEIKKQLPEGVEIVTVYDRSGVIDRGVRTLKVKLIEEFLLVAVICAAFLMHVRSALVAIVTIPVGILIAFIVMRLQGVDANIMSLGGIAIAIGAMVDAAIVMVENAHKHLEEQEGSHWNVIAKAAVEVGPSLFYSLLIITISFLPIFALEGQEGKLFKPLAYTKTYAMAAGAILAVTLVPVLMGIFIKGGGLRKEKDNPISRWLEKTYLPLLDWALKKKRAVLVGAGMLVAVSFVPLYFMGSEFMPSLNEGDLLYMPTTMPSISITKSKEILQQTDKIIKSFPEVEHVFGKIGRAETATDPAPLSMIETIIKLRPENEWRSGMTLERLKNELNEALRLPGISNAGLTMPIETRIDMLSTGIRSPVGIKIAGSDITTLARVAAEIEGHLAALPETASVFAERVDGGNYIDFEIKRKEAARYGLTIEDVNDVIRSAIGGMNVTYTVEGRERYPVSIRYGRELRDDVEKLSRVLIPAPGGRHIPISLVADIKIKKGPSEIKSEDARLSAWIYVYPKGSVGSYVKSAGKMLDQMVKLPDGYTLSWSGRYEYMTRAWKRIMFIAPVVLGLIVLLLYLNFRNISECLIVMLSLPFALVGGVWLMFVLGYNLSVASAAGFIALAGVAAETGVVMLLYLDIAYKKKCKEKRSLEAEELKGVIVEGACRRLRPKMMTVAAIIGGLLPIMWGVTTGSEVMKRIAAPMIGGMLTATLLTLIVIPVVYSLWKEKKAG